MANACHRIRDLHILKGTAPAKHAIPDAGHGVWNLHGHVPNTSSPMLVTELGIFMVCKALQFWKALSPMRLTEVGISNRSKAVQPSKAEVPILITEADNTGSTCWNFYKDQLALYGRCSVHRLNDVLEADQSQDLRILESRPTPVDSK